MVALISFVRQLIVVGNVLEMASKARGKDPISNNFFFDLVQIT